MGLFKTLTNFSLLKFDELVTLMVPTIQTYAQSIGEAHIVISYKLIESRIVIAPIHLVHEIKQWNHVEHIPMELKCNV